jgi:phosphoribosylanthranilate isomerase
MPCSIKICGVTNVADASMIAEAGADYLGVLVNVTRSPRSVTVEKAKKIFSSVKIPTVLLTFDLASEQVIDLAGSLSPFGVQLAGNETEEEIEKLKSTLSCEIWKTLHIAASNLKEVTVNDIVKKINSFTEAGVDRIVLDSAVIKGNTMQQGGTGRTFNWSLAREIKTQVKTSLFLAGGIKPDNVKDALLQVNPEGIDLSSGVEKSVGKKDKHLVKSLIANVKNAKVSL